MKMWRDNHGKGTFFSFDMGSHIVADLSGNNNIYLGDRMPLEEIDNDLDFEWTITLKWRGVPMQSSTLKSTRAEDAKKEALEFLRIFFAPVVEKVYLYANHIL